ncbi:hypothetical protein E3N88_12285 [Mikania micrantha]|uniref:Peptidase A2 domain-containing protein n=1 Tax=Mikania micrantha TaxID=192012 RepID=A0A5N6P7M5_9ASTR|nr:hypothetical protein E3N88_12285 [Mikania micrantha]
MLDANFSGGGTESPGDDTLGTCLALEFECTLSIHGGAATMKLEGVLRGIPVIMLVDSGASHNFIPHKLVAALGLPSTPFGGIKIKLGDGHFVFVNQRCLAISIKIGSCTFSLDALVLDTGTLDFILGMEWLRSLGEVVHDWNHSWMRFTFKGNPVQLQGFGEGQNTPVALHQWLSCAEVVPLDSKRVPSPLEASLIPITSLEQDELT